MKVNLVTPYGTTYQGVNVESITIPTKEGVITVKDDHVPILYLIIPGEVVIEDEAGNVSEFAISKGIIEVLRESNVNILADTAERGDEIDIERAEEARKKAQEFLAQKNYEADVDFAKVQAELEKEMARVRVARKYKNVGRSLSN